MNPSITRKNKAKRPGQRQGGGQNRQNNDHIVKLRKHIIPDEVEVPLRYYWATVILNNTGQRTASHQLLVNGAFDIDASLGSTSAVGFNEWSTLYNRYRVLSVRLEAIFINADAVPTFCCLSLGNTSFASNGFNQSYWGDDYSDWGTLGQSTGNDTSKRLVVQGKISQVVGDPSASNDADYSAIISANPTKLVFGNLAIDSGTNTYTMTNGAIVRCQLTLHTRFYNRVSLAV
jgi:hypothetical protein